MGPSVDQVMTAGGRGGEIRGDISFAIADSGKLQAGEPRLADGTAYPVVGQATGHSLQMRFLLGPELAQVAVGVGEEEIADCQGAINGLATGPSIGDIGEWHATARKAEDERTRNGPDMEDAPGQPPSTPGPAPAPGSLPESRCGAGLTRCGGACVDLRSDLHHCGACGVVCQSGLVPVACRNGVRERANCPEDIAYCGAIDGCRDLSSDPAHRGACQNLCANGISAEGVCAGSDR